MEKDKYEIVIHNGERCLRVPIEDAVKVYHTCLNLPIKEDLTETSWLVDASGVFYINKLISWRENEDFRRQASEAFMSLFDIEYDTAYRLHKLTAIANNGNAG